MNPFGIMWAALKRAAASLNAFSDQMDQITEELGARRLGHAVTSPPDLIEGKVSEPQNGASRRKAASA